TTRCTAGGRIVLPVKHGDGRHLPPPDLDPTQVVLRYLDNPNGSIGGIAGVCNETGNVMGLMPHPEHAVDPLLGSDDGALLLASPGGARRARVLAGTWRQQAGRRGGGGWRGGGGFQPSDVSLSGGDRPARPAAGTGVREADEPLPFRGLEQLDLRREPLGPR